jgi:protease-4
MEEILFKIGKAAIASLLIIVFVIISTSCLNINIGCPGESVPELEGKNILVLEANGNVPECDRGGLSLNSLGSSGKTTLLDMIYSLKKAAVDENIVGVIVNFGDWSLGWAQAEDLRDAIKSFRTSGKPIYAFSKIYDNIDYFIATACDKVYLMPQGLVSLTGISATTTHIKRLLDRFGIKVEYVRIGKYKTAPEMFSEEALTPADEEQIGKYIDTIYSELLKSIADDRHQDLDKLKTQLNEGFKSYSTGMVDTGLIDGFLNFDELTAIFEKGHVPVHTVSHLDYQKIPAEDLGLNDGPEVAVIFATGAINQGNDSTNFFSGSQAMGSDTMEGYIKAAREDKDIRAIILRVDSPGGDGLASEAILRELVLAKKSKPVVVSMGNVAASGGYYISALADEIFAQPATLTGSIGVFFLTYNMKDLYNRAGVNRQTIKRGKFSDLFNNSRDITPEERELGQRIIQDFYNRFISLVAEGRKTTADKIDMIAQGRIWSGTDAKDNGLIDELGGLEAALNHAKVLAKIPASQQIKIILYPARKNICEMIMNKPGDNTISIGLMEGIMSSLPVEAVKILGYAEEILNGRNSPVMAMLPFHVQLN